MRTYLFKTPTLIKELYPKYTWNIKTDKQEIFLSFDDGPHPEITPWVLDVLKQHNAKATFFCVGDNIKKYPETFSKIIRSGHGIGNHTYNHLNGWTTKTGLYLKNIEQTSQLITLNTKHETQNTKPVTRHHLFRPPYGKIKTKQAKQLLKNHYKIIMWDVLSGDFDININPDDCLKNTLSNTKKGSIVVFHDSKKAFERLQYILPVFLSYFGKKGFQFSKIT